MLFTVIAVFLAAHPQGNQPQNQPQRGASAQQREYNQQVAERDRGPDKPNLYDYNEREIRGELRREAYYRSQANGDGDSCNSCDTNRPTIWPRQLRDPGDD